MVEGFAILQATKNSLMICLSRIKNRAFSPQLLDANEKQVRRMLKNKHKMSREEYTELMLKQIIFYMSKGYTQTEIAEKTRRYVSYRSKLHQQIRYHKHRH